MPIKRVANFSLTSTDKIVYPVLKPKWTSTLKDILVKFIYIDFGRRALIYKIISDIDNDYTALTQETKDLLSGIMQTARSSHVFLNLVDQETFMTLLYNFFKLSDSVSLSGCFSKDLEKCYNELTSYLDKDVNRYSSYKMFALIKADYQKYKEIFAAINQKAEDRYDVRRFILFFHREHASSQSFEETLMNTETLLKLNPDLKETFDFFLKADKESKTLKSHYFTLAQNAPHAYVCQATAIAHQVQTLLIHIETKNELFRKLRSSFADPLLENPFVIHLKIKYGCLIQDLNAFLIKINKSLSGLIQEWGNKREDFTAKIDELEKELLKEQPSLTLEDKMSITEEQNALSIAINRTDLHKSMKDLFSFPSWKVFYYLCHITEAAERLRSFFENLDLAKMKLDKLPPEKQQAYDHSLLHLKEAFELCKGIAVFFGLTEEEFSTRLSESPKKVRAFLTNIKRLDETIEDLLQYMAQDETEEEREEKTGEELPEKDRSLIALFKEMVASQPALISLSAAVILPRNDSNIENQVQTFTTYLRFKEAISQLIARFSPTISSHAAPYVEKALGLSEYFRSGYKAIAEEDGVFYPTLKQLKHAHKLAKEKFFFLDQTKSSDQERMLFEYLILLIISGKWVPPCPYQVSLCPLPYKNFWIGKTLECKDKNGHHQPYFLWHLENTVDKQSIHLEKIRNEEVKRFFLDRIFNPTRFHFVVDGQETIFDTDNPQAIPANIAEIRKQLIRVLTKDNSISNAKRIQDLLKANAALEPLIPRELTKEQFCQLLQSVASEGLEKGQAADLAGISQASRFTEEELESLSCKSGISSHELADLGSKEVLKFMCIATQSSLSTILTQQFLPIDKAVREAITQTIIPSNEKDLCNTVVFNLDNITMLAESFDILFQVRELEQRRNKEVNLFFLDNVIRSSKFQFVFDGQTTVFDTINPQVMSDIIAEVRKQLIRALTKKDPATNADKIKALVNANASLDPLIPLQLNQEKFCKLLQSIAPAVLGKGNKFTGLVEKMSQASRFTEQELQDLSRFSGLSVRELADLGSKEVLKFMCVATQNSLLMLLSQQFLSSTEKNACREISTTFEASFVPDLSKKFFSLDASMAFTASQKILFLARKLSNETLQVCGNFDLNTQRDSENQAAYLVGYTTSLTVTDFTLTHREHSYVPYDRPNCSADGIPLSKKIGDCFEESFLASNAKE